MTGSGHDLAGAVLLREVGSRHTSKANRNILTIHNGRRAYFLYLERCMQRAHLPQHIGGIASQSLRTAVAMFGSAHSLVNINHAYTHCHMILAAINMGQGHCGGLS